MPFLPNGLPLFENGVPVSGDVTDKIFLDDAGTEADEYPSAALFQVIRQSGGDSGPVDPDGKVILIHPTEVPSIPANANVIKVTVESVFK